MLGMLYVALSRSTGRANTKIQISEGTSQGKVKRGSSDMYTLNPVYREVLR